MPPPDGRLTAELRHKSEMHIGAAVCSAAWGTLCRCVRFYGPTAHPCRSTLHKRRVRPPWRREENRIKNFDWVILFGHSKPISIPSMGERKPNEAETVSLAGRIAPDDEHDRRCQPSLAFPEPERISWPTVTAISRRFRSADALLSRARNFLGWLNRQGRQNKNAPEAQNSTRYFSCACGSRVS